MVTAAPTTRYTFVFVFCRDDHISGRRSGHVLVLLPPRCAYIMDQGGTFAYETENRHLKLPPPPGDIRGCRLQCFEVRGKKRVQRGDTDMIKVENGGSVASLLEDQKSPGIEELKN
ncbi:conserved hypothetical protein [Culex quinquefasciatus]|uniref:Uncharacterized protein n=1 Tax=Culex quinquefasciatus TaxID=7176 RepID=B0WKK9_CULQU|nr:conserved hypothetical protein [Culex quinquefasciatus]|eukprot:XP_001849243.1 conserved hypothetical protein [Culex quinquefasciatus]